MPGDEPLHSIRAQWSTTRTRKERIVEFTCLQRRPLLQNDGYVREQWCAAQFSALTHALDVSTSSGVYVFPLQRRDLAIAKAGLRGKQQEGSVPPSDPSGCVGCGDQSGGFFLSKELDWSLFIALRRNG
jgi:hypothetical protein